jgi:hypothetical protein
MAEQEPKAIARAAAPPRASQEAGGNKSAMPGDRPDTIIPPNWAPNMLVYGDVSRMLFRMHRNVAAHMDAHKRLAERMRAVFSHEQAMVLELARLIDESVATAARASNEDKSLPLGTDSIDRIFDHASNAMKETGRMLTDIQLESLALLQHYIAESTDGGTKPAPQPDTNQGKGKK